LIFHAVCPTAYTHEADDMACKYMLSVPESVVAFKPIGLRLLKIELA